MNYKNLFLLLMVTQIMGCSDYIKGQKKEEKSLKLSGNQFACLKDTPEILRNIFSENSEPQKIEVALTCIEGSLSYFIKRTKGNVVNGYSVQDLRSFFGKYLGDNDLVSDAMAIQMMKAKKALLGGSEEVIMKSELQSLINLIGGMREEVHTLRPHWDAVTLKDSAITSRESLLISHLALKEALIKLILRTHLVDSDYGFSDFEALVKEVEKFVRVSPNQKSLRMSDWLPLAESIKIQLFTDHSNLRSSASWKEAIDMVLQLHRLYSLYQYQYKTKEFYSREGFASMDEILHTALKVLDSSWWMDEGGIPFEKTYKLFELLEERKILPLGIKCLAAFESYQVLVQKFLSGGDKKLAALTKLTAQHVDFLKNEYRSFKVVQTFNDSMTDDFSYSNMIEKLNSSQVVVPKVFTDLQSDILYSSWRDWHTHLKQEHPLFYLKTGKLVLDRKAKTSRDWTWHSLSQLNIMRFLNRVLMFTFGRTRNLDLALEHLDEPAFKSFYFDFWNLGVTLQAFDKRSGNAGKRTFFEADHFVYSANGDGQVKLQESFELVNVVVSAGISGLSQIQKDLSKSICALPEKDGFGNPWLDRKCTQEVLRKKFPEYFKNLVGFSKWVQNLSDEEWDYFFNEWVLFSQMNPEETERIETGDLRTMVVIAHYVESLYIKFDKNEDDRISVQELVAGSSRFTPFFKKHYGLEFSSPFFPKVLDDSLDFAMSHMFACMILEGKMPSLMSCSKSLIKDMITLNPYANRALILKTLNGLKSTIK